MSKKDKPAVPQPVAAWPQPQPPVYAPPTIGYAPPAPYQGASAAIMQDRNATVAKVSVNQNSSYNFGSAPDFAFTATGSSKREQGDRFNARTGELLALSRAYLNLSRKLYAAGKELVEPEPAPEFEAAMSSMEELIAAELEHGAPEDNFVGVGVYPDVPVLHDPTDEDVAMAKEILTARADYNAAVAELEAQEDSFMPQEDLDAAVKAFNDAAEALNQVRNVLGQFV